MKYLPFERAYALESSPCDRCAGSGRYGAGVRQCHNCRGLGRTITRAGRALFYELAELLGKPVLARESRIPVRHFDRLLAKQLRPGMRVARIRYNAFRDYRELRTVEPRETTIRLTFDDGTVQAPGSLETYDRELTPAELDRAEELLASRVGAGAEPIAKAD